MNVCLRCCFCGHLSPAAWRSDLQNRPAMVRFGTFINEIKLLRILQIKVLFSLFI
jgi:hypothetical protein